jgi:hypothetical protein
MATRSYIAIENDDDTVDSILCHWNGAPENNGRLLYERFSNKDKLKELIALGNISVLYTRLHPTGKHSFDKPREATTVAYHRDRGDAWRDVKPIKHDSLDKFVQIPMPNSLETWWQCLGQKDRGNYEYERAIIALLEFWLFAFPYYAPKIPSLTEFALGIKEFCEEYDRQIESLTCNGAESECFDFYPEGSKEYDYTVDHYLNGKPCDVFAV